MERKLHVWSKQDEDYLLQEYPKKEVSVKSIAEHLNLSISLVKKKARAMGLSKREVHRWRTNDEWLIRRHFGRMPLEELAEKIGVSPQAVDSHAYKCMGLCKIRRYD